MEIFKKTPEESHILEGVEIPLEIEVPVQFEEVQDAIETKEAPTEPPKAEEDEQKMFESNLTAILETLKQEESSLINQKQQLISNEEQLRLKTMEEIEKTKARISGLKSEIPELKQKCQDMAKALMTPVCNTSD